MLKIQKLLGILKNVTILKIGSLLKCSHFQKKISYTPMVISYRLTSKKVMASLPVPVIPRPIIPPMNMQNK